MPKVVVVQENPHLDYSDAERYGDVEFITNLEYSDMANSLNNEHVLSDVRNKMAKFNPNEDYLLMTGNPITMGYAFHLAMEIAEAGAARQQIKLLRWDGITRTYRAVNF